jgi:hypothetical protein
MVEQMRQSLSEIMREKVKSFFMGFDFCWKISPIINLFLQIQANYLVEHFNIAYVFLFLTNSAKIFHLLQN